MINKQSINLLNPRVEVDINKLKENAKIVVQLCGKQNISVALVTKGYCGNREISKEISKVGIKYLADSRINNLKKYYDLDIKKILLRIPMKSRAKEVVTYSDISFNSEIEVIKELNKCSEELNIIHSIVLMMDLGDLREGFINEVNLYNAIEEITQLKHIKIVGLGVNFTCLNGVIPDKYNNEKFINTAHYIEEKYGIDLEILSGGNSSSFYLVENKTINNYINNLRIGEGILFGRETTFGKRIDGTFDDCFTLKAEIIEKKLKPTMPIGEVLDDPFGDIICNPKPGIRYEAICAVGIQDIRPNNIFTVDDKIKIVGSTSDHLIIDITNCSEEYKVGSEVEFNINYGGLLTLMSSEYINKYMVEGDDIKRI